MYLFFCVCASNMLKSLGCFHLVNFVIVHFGNYSLFSTTAGYFFVWLGLRLFLQSSIWASAVLLIYCYYNKDSRNSLSAGVRLLASFSFETILSLAWPDTVLSCLSWDVSGCTFLSPLPSSLSPPCPLNVRGTWGLLLGSLFSLHFSLDVLIHSRASKR